jgi:hypothetical protein
MQEKFLSRRMKIFTALSILLLNGSLTWAFDSKKCHEANVEVSNWVGPFGLFTSSGQFTSSTGGCAAIGLNSNQKTQAFVASNIKELQKDIARGDGEYLTALTHLLGLDPNLSSAFKNKMQRHYDQFFQATKANGDPSDLIMKFAIDFVQKSLG